jgi:hypothetical protein
MRRAKKVAVANAGGLRVRQRHAHWGAANDALAKSSPATSGNVADTATRSVSRHAGNGGHLLIAAHFGQRFDGGSRVRARKLRRGFAVRTDARRRASAQSFPSATDAAYPAGRKKTRKRSPTLTTLAATIFLLPGARCSAPIMALSSRAGSMKALAFTICSSANWLRESASRRWNYALSHSRGKTCCWRACGAKRSL